MVPGWYPTGFNGSNALFYSNCRLGARITHYSMHIPIKMGFMTTESNFNTNKRTRNIFRGIFFWFLLHPNLFITRKIKPRLIFDSEFTTFTCSDISLHNIKNDTSPKKYYFMLLPLKSPFYLLDFLFSDFNSELPQGFWAGKEFYLFCNKCTMYNVDQISKIKSVALKHNQQLIACLEFQM